ncbi:uncharacterized protein LOC144339419 [Macaca mulatta]
MRLSTEKGEGCERRGSLAAAAPRLRSRPFFLVNFCARAPPGWLGRSPHTRGGEATAAAGLGARSHSPQHAEPSNSAATRGHISAPAAGSPPPPPPVSGAAAAAAVTGRTDRRRPSQAGPTAQAARPRARALPPLPARSPACSPPARAAHAHSAPPRNRGC